MEAPSLQEMDLRRQRRTALLMPAVVVVGILAIDFANWILGIRTAEDYAFGLLVLAFLLNPTWRGNMPRWKFALMTVGAVAAWVLIRFGGGPSRALVGVAMAIGFAVVMVKSYRRDRAFSAQSPTNSISR